MNLSLERRNPAGGPGSEGASLGGGMQEQDSRKPSPVLRGKRCQCCACGEYFSRERAFDRHRVGAYAEPGQWRGNRRCLTVAEMFAKGWQRNDEGFWIIDPLDAAGRARKRGGERKGHDGMPEAVQ